MASFSLRSLLLFTTLSATVSHFETLLKRHCQSFCASSKAIVRHNGPVLITNFNSSLFQKALGDPHCFTHSLRKFYLNFGVESLRISWKWIGGTHWKSFAIPHCHSLICIDKPFFFLIHETLMCCSYHKFSLSLCAHTYNWMEWVAPTAELYPILSVTY